MTFEEFKSIDWRFGNKVLLGNGKEYLVLKKTSKLLFLFTYEYKKNFLVPPEYIVKRTSDKVINRPKKNKRKKMQTQVAKVAKVEASETTKPKRKRMRIVRTVTEKVTY